MKNIPSNILLKLLLLFSFYTYAQSDCPDAIIVCGDNNYSGLNATGIGVQELDISNACGSIENNSLWLKILIKDGGTLGFVLTPESDNLEVDFDFWMFGPDVECNDLGTAIRCSTTNPLNAGIDYNTTGMNDEATDTSEGPAEDGNAFVHWLTVENDETYYLIIDRPHGSANFGIQWTGTATFHDVPVFYNPDNIPLDITKCDADGIDDGATNFDLTQYSEMFIGDQTHVELSYHLSVNDMVTGENPIPNPESYNNISNPQTIYLRMTNTATGCYANETFSIFIDDVLLPEEPEDLEACDFEDNGIQTFDLWENNDIITNGDSNAVVTYFASQEDAENKTNALDRFYQNRQPYISDTIWARMEYITGCFGHGLTSFTVNIIPPVDFSYTTDIVDFTNSKNSIQLNMASGNENFEYSINGVIFSDNNIFENLTPGIYTVYVKSKDNCKTIEFDVPILNFPKFFTPNGDSVNEVWNVMFVRYFPDAQVTIFDRYGKLIKSYLGKQQGWDGTYNGHNLPATDYWFKLEFNNGRVVKSHFSLVR